MIIRTFKIIAYTALFKSCIAERMLTNLKPIKLFGVLIFVLVVDFPHLCKKFLWAVSGRWPQPPPLPLHDFIYMEHNFKTSSFSELLSWLEPCYIPILLHRVLTCIQKDRHIHIMVLVPFDKKYTEIKILKARPFSLHLIRCHSPITVQQFVYCCIKHVTL